VLVLVVGLVFIELLLVIVGDEADATVEVGREPDLRGAAYLCVIPEMAAKPEERAKALALMQERPALSDRAIARRLGLGNRTVSRWRHEAGLERETVPAVEGLLGTRLRAGLAEIEVSLDQFRRWRATGLVPTAARHWYRGGSVSIYPARTLAQTVAAKELVSRYHSLEQAALGLFARGWPIDEATVRDLYRRWLLRAGTNLAVPYQILHSDEPRWDAASAALEQAVTARRSLSFLRSAARGRQDALGGRVSLRGATLDHLRETTEIFVTGQLESTEALAAMLRMIGPSGMAPERQLEMSRSLHSASSIRALRATVNRAPFQELTEAVDGVVFQYLMWILVLDGGLVHIGAPLPPGVSSPALDRLGEDPALLSRLALIVASVRRNPDIGGEVAESLSLGEDDCWEAVRFLLRELGGRAPRLDDLCARYLAARTGDWS
jgi:hypothetical protein